jgi:hypothetical protein
MVFVEPEKAVCDQEVTHFASAEVEDQRAPIAVFSLPRIGVFVAAARGESTLRGLLVLPRIILDLSYRSFRPERASMGIERFRRNGLKR